MIYRRNPHGARATTATMIPLRHRSPSPGAMSGGAHSEAMDASPSELAGSMGLGATLSPRKGAAFARVTCAAATSNHTMSTTAASSSSSATAASSTRRLARCCVRTRPTTRSDDLDADSLPPVPSASSSSSSSSTTSSSRGSTHAFLASRRPRRGAGSTLRARLLHTLWLALLVYAFLGLPVLARILNVARYFHRFTATSMLSGLGVGLLQDLAVLAQASTVIVIIKAVLQPYALHRRLAATLASTTSALSSSSSTTSSSSAFHGSSISSSSSGGNGVASAVLAQERYPHSYTGRFVQMPVYFPVRTNDYELPHVVLALDNDHQHLEQGMNSSGSSSASAVPSKHLTIVASSRLATPAFFPWSIPSSSPAGKLFWRLRSSAHVALTVILLLLVVLGATLAVVADLSLQISLHPRLSRSLVATFARYAAQFTARFFFDHRSSLGDLEGERRGGGGGGDVDGGEEEMRVATATLAWTGYLVLVALLTYGFYHDRLPLVPDALSYRSVTAPTASSRELMAAVRRCCGCLVAKKRASSSASLSIHETELGVPTTAMDDEEGSPRRRLLQPGTYMKALYKSYWRRLSRRGRSASAANASTAAAEVDAAVAAAAAADVAVVVDSSSSSSSAVAAISPTDSDTENDKDNGNDIDPHEDRDGEETDAADGTSLTLATASSASSSSTSSHRPRGSTRRPRRVSSTQFQHAQAFNHLQPRYQQHLSQHPMGSSSSSSSSSSSPLPTAPSWLARLAIAWHVVGQIWGLRRHAYAKPPRSPRVMVAHCVLVTAILTTLALSASMLVNTSPAAMKAAAAAATAGNPHSAFHGDADDVAHRIRWSLGVDMQLMSNALFALETEPLLSRSRHQLNLNLQVYGGESRRPINCVAASQTLLATLSVSEQYATQDMGNEDSCALLWRRTTGFQGETLWDLDWNHTFPLNDQMIAVTDDDAQEKIPATPLDELNTGSKSEAATTAVEGKNESDPVLAPNVIVINMASWRALDVGVLGGASKKRRFGVSATPEFDRLSLEGVLYRRHYSPCVTSARSLLTTLFGMYPSCTETSALGRYNSSSGGVEATTAGDAKPSTGLNIRGLPQFLKERGYFNLFWHAEPAGGSEFTRAMSSSPSSASWDRFLLGNGFDKVVDTKKVRGMLQDVQHRPRGVNPDDEKLGIGADEEEEAEPVATTAMHDQLSFDMLLYALEVAQNRSMGGFDLSNNSTEGHIGVGSGNGEVEPETETMTGSSASIPANDRNATEDEGGVGIEPSVEPLNTPPSSFQARLRSQDVAANATMLASSRESDVKDGSATTTEQSDEDDASLSPLAPGWEGLRAPFFIDMYSTSTSRAPHFGIPSSVAAAAGYEAPDLSALHTRFNREYVDAVAFSDAMLGQFIDDLRAKGLMKHTIVVIQGDHGVGRMEHGSNPSTTDSALYDELTHVPFLLLADDFLAPSQRGQTVDQLTMQSDLMATVADILGVTEQEPLYQHGVGHSMRRRHQPEMRATSASAKSDRQVLLCNPFEGGTMGAVTEQQARKYMFQGDGAFKVFALATDPEEQDPIRIGYDVEQMDEPTRHVFDDVAELVDLHQFLFETDKFVAAQVMPSTVEDGDGAYETVQDAPMTPTPAEHS